MTEAQFWKRLELRVSAELACLSTANLQALSCQKLTPEAYLLDKEQPAIVGRALIREMGQTRSEWQFAIAVPDGFAFAGCAGWDALYPPETMTRWCSVHEQAKHLLLVPAVATSRDRYTAAQPADPADVRLVAWLLARRG